MIYLDYNATTPIDKGVADAMLPYIHGNYGNPSSGHEFGVAAKKAVEAARGQVASLLGADGSEIVFTSGGSESNNTVIKGVAFSFRAKGNHIVTSRIEHPAVLNPCRFLEQNGCTVTYLPVDRYGSVSPMDVEKAITAKTILVTIMHANNETGTIQPIPAISRICRSRGVLLHADAAQSVGKIPTRVDDLGVDLLTVHGHDLKTMRAAVTGRGPAKLKLLAVTVLTNLSEEDLKQQGLSLTPADMVVRRAVLAREAGFDGVIASGQEAARVREAVGPGFLIVTPGIRLSGGATDDQQRITTPDNAIKAGADCIVVGRPIREAQDRRAAADHIQQMLAALFK